MNKYTAIDVSYMTPSKTIETILLEDGTRKKIIYVYNLDGIHFLVFNFIVNIIEFFNEEFEPEIIFETEDELSDFLTNLNLEMIFGASPILKSQKFQ